LPAIARQQNHCHLRPKRRRYCYFCRTLDTPEGRDHVADGASDFSGTSAGAAGIKTMQQAVILFWSAPSRISRRVAQFVAIAATALRDVGV
jgi:hypothetical protein